MERRRGIKTKHQKGKKLFCLTGLHRRRLKCHLEFFLFFFTDFLTGAKMRKTFFCDESIVITIPLGSLKNMREGQLLPENFHCVFRDNFKVFAIKGKPKPLGVSSALRHKKTPQLHQCFAQNVRKCMFGRWFLYGNNAFLQQITWLAPGRSRNS